MKRSIDNLILTKEMRRKCQSHETKLTRLLPREVVSTRAESGRSQTRYPPLIFTTLTVKKRSSESCSPGDPGGRTGQG